MYMSDQETKYTPSGTAVPPTDPDLTQLRQLITAHAIPALRTLRRAMFDPRASPATRSRAAQVVLELALRTAAMEDAEAQLARLEELAPQKAALERITEGELRRLQNLIMDREEGTDLNPQQIALARKFAALEQDIRASKLHRLSKRQPATQR